MTPQKVIISLLVVLFLTMLISSPNLFDFTCFIITFGVIWKLELFKDT